MLSGPVELLFLLFLITVRTCAVVMFICVGCRLSTFLVTFLFVVLVLWRIVLMNCLLKALAMSLGLMCVLNVMELLSCCGGRLWARPCIVFQ